MSICSYTKLKFLIAFALVVTGTSAIAQTSEPAQKVSKPKNALIVPPVKVESEIRQELKRHVSSLTFKQGGVRIIRRAKKPLPATTFQGNTEVLRKIALKETLQTLDANAASDQSEYAISCNPLGLPDSIDETYGTSERGRNTFISKTDSGIVLKAYKKASTEHLKTLERIALLSCVETEIK